MTGVLRRRPSEDTKIHREEGHMKTEAEIGVMHLQAKEHCELLATTRGQERDMEHITPQNLEPALPTP